MQKPIRAIVGRFSFDFASRMIENVLREYPFEFCGIISSGVDPRYFHSIPSEKQQWFASSQIRGCEYPGVRWAELEPLDEELIEGMRECEAVFMEMVSRLEWKRHVSYSTRTFWYLRHLRFWNDYLTRHRINLYLSAWIPHEIPDIIIYYLCKLRKIPVVYFGISTILDTSFIEHDWEESNVQTGARYAQLLTRYPDTTDPLAIPLSERFERRYRALVSSAGEVPPPERQELDVSYGKSIRHLLFTRPLLFLRYLFLYLTPAGIARAIRAWQRRMEAGRAMQFYDAHAVTPDLSQSFVYLPLHFQPEATTVPQAGGYADQVLIAQMLNATLSENFLIYVKEHPRPSALQKHDIVFYKQFLDLPKVRLMPRGYDTFVLREHCKATATASGTAGFEGLFRGKPVLLFGHCYYQYAPGAYRIHSTEDCARAVREVFTEGRSPTLLHCRLYLKAMEETCIHGVTDTYCYRVTRLTEQENAANCSAAILKELRDIVQ